MRYDLYGHRTADKARYLKRSILLASVLLALLCLIVLSQAWPSSEAARLRNALVITSSVDVNAVNWRSVDQPPGFLQESGVAPDAIRRFVGGVSAGSDLELARALASHLISRLGDGGPVRSLDAAATYRAITERGIGYCSDVVDTFTALATAAGLQVRQWAFSFDGFGGHGHVIAEVFDRQLSKWVALDVFNNLMPVHAGSGIPLSATELRSTMMSDESLLRFVTIGPGRSISEAKLREYYRNGLDQWYFWNGNNVISRGASRWVRAASALGEPIGELVAIARGEFPSIVPIPTSSNGPMVARMHRLQYALIVAAGLAILLVLLISVLVFLLLREHGRERPIREVTDAR